MWKAIKQVVSDVKEVVEMNAVNSSLTVVKELGSVSKWLDSKKETVQDKVFAKVSDSNVTSKEEAMKAAFRTGYDGKEIKKEKKSKEVINWSGINAMNKR